MDNWLKSLWYSDQNSKTALPYRAMRLLLLPLSYLFRLVAFTRRTLYRIGVLSAYRTKIPVIIIGNIHIGGTGKTPVILKLVQLLRNKEIRVAVISRGYGGQAPFYPYEVQCDSQAEHSGDEPLLIKQNHPNIPVIVAPKRVDSVRYIEQHYPGTQLILSDDGLQHYALQRDCEIAVLDAARLGNGCCLPAGPMREPWRRLQQVDWVIVNQNAVSDQNNPDLIPLSYLGQPYLSAQLAPVAWVSLHNNEQRAPNAFAGQAANLIAGIGDPERFFQQCTTLGIDLLTAQGFADHHAYQPQDLAALQAPLLLMTEKDAVKCRQWGADDILKQAWYLKVELVIAAEDELVSQIIDCCSTA